MVALNTPRAGVATGTRRRFVRLPGPGAIAVTTLVAAAALLPVVQNSNATTTGYDIREMERRKSDLQAAMYNAQMDIARLGSLQRIDQEARARLGMVPADRTFVVSVREPAPQQRQIPARYLPVEPAGEAAAPERGLLDALLARLSLR